MSDQHQVRTDAHLKGASTMRLRQSPDFLRLSQEKSQVDK